MLVAVMVKSGESLNTFRNLFPRQPVHMFAFPLMHRQLTAELRLRNNVGVELHRAARNMRWNAKADEVPRGREVRFRFQARFFPLLKPEFSAGVKVVEEF